MLHSGAMKVFCILVLVCVRPFVVSAQQESPDLDDLIEVGQQWAQENLDDEVLSALQSMDMTTVQKFFDEMQQRFQSDYVVDIDQLSQMAISTLSLLEAHPETQPYAAWLKTRLDYFDVAGKFRATAPPVPAPEPGRPPPRIPNPSAEKEREVWRVEVEKRAPPKGAGGLAARLRPIFVAHQVPSALVWVAEVESSFAPNARSPSGAVGLFQLMPATAKRLNLSLWPFDQRLDPEKNARGSAKYLKLLHNKFKDWPLALAAYNCGEGRVQALLKKHKVKTYDEIATRLPAETQLYVPKVNAILLRREGISLADLPAPAQPQ